MPRPLSKKIKDPGRARRKAAYRKRAADSGDPWVTKGLEMRRSAVQRLNELAAGAGCSPARLVTNWVIAGQGPAAAEYAAGAGGEETPALVALPHLYQKQLPGCLRADALKALDEAFARARAADPRVSPVAFLSEIVTWGLKVAPPPRKAQAFAPDRRAEVIDIILHDRASDIAEMSHRLRLGPLETVDLMLDLTDCMDRGDRGRLLDIADQFEGVSS